MKLLSSYIKEMKIAARGFYFYIEIVFAILIVVVLLVAVKDNPISKSKEFLYFDMPQESFNSLMENDLEQGTLKMVDATTFEIKALSFDVTNEETGEVKSYDFKNESIEVDTYQAFDIDTNELVKTMYITKSERELIGLSYSEKAIGATTIMNDSYEVSFRYYNQGYETDKYKSLLYVLHNENSNLLEETINNQTIRELGEIDTLSVRENMVPVMVVFMGSLMGFFIVMAYIFLDKSEGVIKAFAVTPSSVWKYLLSKTMVIMSTVVVSSSIITIPIMGSQPNYLLFYLYLIISTFTFASLGLLISSFFNSISKSFGALYAIMITMMIPAFSYYIPSFDPLWLRFFPTYPLLQGFKEILMVNGDTGYVLMYSGAFLVVGLLLFLFANIRFKKTLTV